MRTYNVRITSVYVCIVRIRTYFLHQNPLARPIRTYEPIRAYTYDIRTLYVRYTYAIRTYTYALRTYTYRARQRVLVQKKTGDNRIWSVYVRILFVFEYKKRVYYK